jgi:hypothetical protein
MNLAKQSSFGRICRSNDHVQPLGFESRDECHASERIILNDRQPYPHRLSIRFIEQICRQIIGKRRHLLG